LLEEKQGLLLECSDRAELVAEQQAKIKYFICQIIEISKGEKGTLMPLSDDCLGLEPYSTDKLEMILTRQLFLAQETAKQLELSYRALLGEF